MVLNFRLTSILSFLALFGLLVVGLLLGCGEKRSGTAVVRGKVTYNGKPVPNGTVNFIPTRGATTATGEIHPDGSYALTTYKPGDGAVRRVDH